MKGCEFLVPEDTVEIFFSKSCSTINHGIFQTLQVSGCEIRICKLQKTGKNALDFYIATRVGALFGMDSQSEVVIVSNDQGYKAVRDYWNNCADGKKRVLISPTIGNGIVSAQKKDERTQNACESLRQVSIEAEFAKYEIERKLRQELLKQFGNTRYESQIPAIEELMEKNSSKKILYLDSIKRFGKKDGIQIYRNVRELVS